MADTEQEISLLFRGTFFEELLAVEDYQDSPILQEKTEEFIDFMTEIEKKTCTILHQCIEKLDASYENPRPSQKQRQKEARLREKVDLYSYLLSFLFNSRLPRKGKTFELRQGYKIVIPRGKTEFEKRLELAQLFPSDATYA